MHWKRGIIPQSSPHKVSVACRSNREHSDVPAPIACISHRTLYSHTSTFSPRGICYIHCYHAGFVIFTASEHIVYSYIDDVLKKV